MVFDDFPWETMTHDEWLHILEPSHSYDHNVKGTSVHVDACPRIVILNKLPESFIKHGNLLRRTRITNIDTESLFLNPHHEEGASLHEFEISGRTAQKYQVDPAKLCLVEGQPQDDRALYRFVGSHEELCQLLDRMGVLKYTNDRRNPGRPPGSGDSMKRTRKWSKKPCMQVQDEARTLT